MSWRSGREEEKKDVNMDVCNGIGTNSMDECMLSDVYMRGRRGKRRWELPLSLTSVPALSSTLMTLRIPTLDNCIQLFEV